LKNSVYTYLFIAIIASVFVAIKLIIPHNDSKNDIKRIALLEGQQLKMPLYLTDIYGNKYQMKGFTLLIFFDLNCPSCQDELLIWSNYSKQKEKLQIIGICKSEINILKNYQQQFAWSFPITHDKNGFFSQMCKIEKYPKSILLKNTQVALVQSTMDLIMWINRIEDYIES
jgi:hypothetical protein